MLVARLVASNMERFQRNLTAFDYHSLGVAYLLKRQMKEAVRCFRQALASGLNPLVGIADRWTACMLLGQFEGAWQETDRIECRRRNGIQVEGQLVWNGNAFTDRIVLLRNNHGLGDSIQFIRYAPLIRRQCRSLLCKAQPILTPLLRKSGFFDEVIDDIHKGPDFDVQIESTELPYAFRTTMQ